MKNLSTNELKKQFTGLIISPEDSQYEELSTTFAGKGTPAIILQPVNAEDVSLSINFARENKLVISVRSGGHSGAGFSTNEGGAVIDMSALNSIQIINEKNRIVKVGTGAKWEEVASFLQEKNFAITAGDTKSVGVGGLTLGGGIGWMVRKYGLTIDHVVGAEIVTADGKILHLSEKENSELFWAIRGGGGNFGVITSFEFEAKPVTDVFFGSLMFDFENLSELLKKWRDYMRKADENLTTSLMLMPSFNGSPSGVMILCCYANSDESMALKAIEPMKTFGKLLTSDIKRMPYKNVLQDAHPPQGVLVIVKSRFFEDFSDQVIQKISTNFGKDTNRFLMIRSVAGRMNQIAEDATAFGFRKSEVLVIAPIFVPPGIPESGMAKITGPWEEISALGKGAYSNFLSTVTDEDVHDIYPEKTYKRLQEIKKTFDPQNIFQMNYNIKP